MSLTQRKELYLHEVLALNLSSARVNVTVRVHVNVCLFVAFNASLLQFDPSVLVLSLNGSASRGVYSKLLNSVTYMNWQVVIE